MIVMTYSVVFDRERAGETFKQVAERDIVLAALAGIVPEPDWDKCLVYVGEPPADQAGNCCIGIRGPAAEKIQERLVEALERIGLTILNLYENGPEPTQKIAKVSRDKWVPATD